MSVKIFCIYNKPSEIFKSSAFEPIQTGFNRSHIDLGFLKDNCGDNIADKNPYYAEMTAWYWVWKNYLKKHPKVDYVGFCHYRRFLDFFSDKLNYNILFSNSRSYSEFKKYFSKNYINKKIYNLISDYDVVVVEKYCVSPLNSSIYEQYVSCHGNIEINTLMDIITKDYTKYKDDMEEFLNGNLGHFCLNFVMKRELYEEFMIWAFELLDKLTETLNQQGYERYKYQKIPAFLMERFFNVWLNYKIKKDNIKILERPGIILF